MRIDVCLALAAALLAGACASPSIGPGNSHTVSTAPVEMFKTAKLGPADGEAARTEALYLSLLRKTPMDYETWFRLGNLYASNNRPDEAAATYERALMGDNGHARAWHNLGVVRLRQSYASLMQGNMTIGAGEEELGKRIEKLIEELAKVSILSDEARMPPPVRK